jgi:hypothetical protein
VGEIKQNWTSNKAAARSAAYTMRRRLNRATRSPHTEWRRGEFYRRPVHGQNHGDLRLNLSVETKRPPGKGGLSLRGVVGCVTNVQRPDPFCPLPAGSIDFR